MNNLRLLIAGVSNSYLEISKRMLQYHYAQCEVDFALSGDDCLAKAIDNAYDLVLIDQDLGDNSGLEIIEKLNTKSQRSPLVLLIEEGEEQLGMRALETGASDYILKVRGYLTALPITIRNILEKRSARRDTGPVKASGKQEKSSEEHASYFILDKKGHILSASENLESITNYSEEELLELNLLDLLPKDRERSFFDWLNIIGHNGNSHQSFRTEVLGKTGEKVYINIDLTPVRDENQRIVSYRGRLENVSEDTSARNAFASDIDQYAMVSHVAHLVNTSQFEPLNIVLQRIVELACQIFGFKRSTVALLDKKRGSFVKQATVGYKVMPTADSKSAEVPQEVIRKIFADRYRVKVIYYNQPHRDTSKYINASFPERRSQTRRPPNQWHKRDLVLVNLMNRTGTTFGYISMDIPVGQKVPMRDTFYNLELFGQLVAMSIENYYRFSALEKRSRRLKQILVTSNIFKLYLSLNNLLKEVVWSVKFSLDFNLVALGLISKRSGNLEMKAVACDDKHKMDKINQLAFPLKPFSGLLRSEYNLGKSYFVIKEEEVLQELKQAFRGDKLASDPEGTWPKWGILLVPIKSREDKVVGMLMVDDPENGRLPGKDTIHTLEIIANQIGVAIDNRILYIQAKNQIHDLKEEIHQHDQQSQLTRQMQQSQYNQPKGIRRFIDSLFK